jgi:hypothetical protein
MKRKTDQETLRTRVRKTRSNPGPTRKKLRTSPEMAARPDLTRAGAAGKTRGKEKGSARVGLEFSSLSSPAVPSSCPRWRPWGAAQESTHTCLSVMESRSTHTWLGFLICFVAIPFHFHGLLLRTLMTCSYEYTGTDGAMPGEVSRTN